MISISKIESEEGFSLVELMMTVAIIGILTAMAVPRFLMLQGRARQAEAKTNLVQIYTLELAYFAARDTYASSIGDLGLSLTAGRSRYNYRIRMCATEAFLAEAEAKTLDSIVPNCTWNDVWWIDQTKSLESVNDCAANKKNIYYSCN